MLWWAVDEPVVLCDTVKIFLCEYERMPKVSVEIPQELLDDLDEHVGDERKFVNRSDAIRAWGMVHPPHVDCVNWVSVTAY